MEIKRDAHKITIFIYQLAVIYVLYTTKNSYKRKGVTMGYTYSSHIGNKIASHGLRKAGNGARFLGRAAVIAAIALTLKDTLGGWSDGLKNNPYHDELIVIAHEYRFWGIGKDYIGRKRFNHEKKEWFYESGAIFNLEKKKLKEAVRDIGKSLEMIGQTKNIVDTDEFEDLRKRVIDVLVQTREALTTDQVVSDLPSHLKTLVDLDDGIEPYVRGLGSRLRTLQEKVQKSAAKGLGEGVKKALMLDLFKL